MARYLPKSSWKIAQLAQLLAGDLTFWIDSEVRRGYFNNYSVTPREISGIWTEDSGGVGLVAVWC